MKCRCLLTPLPGTGEQHFAFTLTCGPKGLNQESSPSYETSGYVQTLFAAVNNAAYYLRQARNPMAIVTLFGRNPPFLGPSGKP
jgi:hypothetical protein